MRRENGSREVRNPLEKSCFKEETKERAVVEGGCRVKKVLDFFFFSFKNGRGLKIVKFCWGGSRREIIERKEIINCVK